MHFVRIAKVDELWNANSARRDDSELKIERKKKYNGTNSWMNGNKCTHSKEQ